MDDATEHRSSDGPGWSADPGTGQREGMGRWAWVRSAAMVGGGLVAGGILAGTLTANAASDTTTTTSVPSYSQEGGAPTGNGDPSQPQRSDEQLLTGDTATKVTDAVLAQYPDATIQRVETDSDGVYEGHIVTADGEQLIVQVGGDFTVTATQSHGR